MLYHTLSFDGIGYSGPAPSWEKFMALKLDKLLGDYSSEETCLDVGCNIGYISYLLNKYNFKKVIGIDLLEQNIKCAKWLKNKFFRDKNIDFYQIDFMKHNVRSDNVFALAMLHHVAAVHGMDKTLKQLDNLTNKRAFIEINEMTLWPIERIKLELKKYFKNVVVVSNSYLPVQKTIVKNRWIIYCDKLDRLGDLF